MSPLYVVQQIKIQENLYGLHTGYPPCMCVGGKLILAVVNSHHSCNTLVFHVAVLWFLSWVVWWSQINNRSVRDCDGVEPRGHWMVGYGYSLGYQLPSINWTFIQTHVFSDCKIWDLVGDWSGAAACLRASIDAFTRCPRKLRTVFNQETIRRTSTNIPCQERGSRHLPSAKLHVINVHPCFVSSS